MLVIGKRVGFGKFYECVDGGDGGGDISCFFFQRKLEFGQVRENDELFGRLMFRCFS